MPLIIRMFSFLALMGCAMMAQAQTELSAMPVMTDGIYKVSLDSCRSMALANNKKMRMAREKVKGAGYMKKEASAAYLPSFDLTGGYAYNSKKLSIFDSDQLLPVKTFDLSSQSYQFSVVKNPITGEPVKGPNGQYIPEQVALIPKEAMEYDVHNVFFGAVTLTQPIYMGGKIMAMNKLTHYAEEAAKALRDNQAADVIYSVDAAYWQVVSVKAKQKLAVNYVALLDTLRHDVQCLYDQGMATKADLLSVEVKLNSAQVDLTKVDNGLVLSRMLLAQLCGLPVDTPVDPSDENPELDGYTMVATSYNMNDVYDRRDDLRALGYAVKAAGAQSDVAKASMLPNVALIGSYEMMNPNMYNGFKKRFSGAFSVGAAVTIPLWHWGGNLNKYRAAKSEAIVKQLELEDAREMVDLQVKQSAFKAREAVKTHEMTLSNLAKADENLRQATLAFREGIMTPENVMEAQTAWLKANSENIDAMIDVRLCDVYLSKVLGTLD